MVIDDIFYILFWLCIDNIILSIYCFMNDFSIIKLEKRLKEYEYKANES